MKNNRLATYICFAILVMFAMVMTIISPLLSEISNTYSLSMSKAGFLFTINFVGFIVFVLLGGVLSDKFGKKRILLISLAGFAATLILFPMSPDFTTACIVTFFMGGFGSIIESMISALVSELNPDRPSFYVNLAHTFLGVGALASPIAAAIAVSSGIRWQLCYYVLGIMAVALTFVFFFVKFPPLPSTDGISWNGFRKLVSSRSFLLICLCMFLYTGSEVGGWGWMSTFLKDNKGFSLTKSSMAVSLFWASMTAGRLMCGILTSRFSLRQIIIVLSLLSAVVTLFTGITGNEAVLWLLIIAMGIAYSSQWPLIVAYGSSRYRDFSGTVFALLIGSGGLGSTIIPYAMGILGDSFSPKIASVSPSLLFLGIFLLFLRFKEINTR